EPARVASGPQPTRPVATAPPGPDRLARPDARGRAVPTVCAPAEHAAHVRDVAGVMAARLRLILDEGDPRFPNWDQDAAAVEGDYPSTDPARVTTELQAAVGALAAAYGAVADEEWDRPGLRSNGSVFTAWTLGVYALHDLEHHLHDVGAEVGER